MSFANVVLLLPFQFAGFFFPSVIALARTSGTLLSIRFNFMRICWMFFQSGCAISHSHQYYVRVPIAPQLHQYLIVSDFLGLAVLLCSGTLWLLLHFPVSSDIELFFHVLYLLFRSVCLHL